MTATVTNTSTNSSTSDSLVENDTPSTQQNTLNIQQTKNNAVDTVAASSSSYSINGINGILQDTITTATSSSTTTTNSITTPYKDHIINGILDTPTMTTLNGLSPIKVSSSGILPTPMTVSSTTAALSNHHYQQNLQRFYSPYVSVSTAGGSSSYPGSSTFNAAAGIFTQPQFSMASVAATPSYSYGGYVSAPPTPTGVTSAANYYTTDPAALAKEVAQKNYANAIKMANNNPLAGKPLTASAYTGMNLNKAFAPPAAAPASMAAHHAALFQAHQMQQAHAAVAAAQMRSMAAASSLPGSSMSSPMHTPTHTPSSGLLQRSATTGYLTANAAAMNQMNMMRPQPMHMSAQTANAQYAAMAAQQAHAGFFYPGMMQAHAGGYPFATMGAMPTVMPAGMQQAAVAAAPAAAPGTAMVLNPYKKMKTS